MKKTEIAVFLFLILCFSSASPIFSLQKSYDFPQFLPKTLAEAAEFQGKYKPIRIYSEVNSGSQDNDAWLENFENSANTASEILSEFLLVHPSRQSIKLGETNHCNSTHFREAPKSQGIDADLVVLFTMQNDSGQSSSNFRICEVSDDNRLITIGIEIDAKWYKGHDRYSKINLLSSAIIQAIFQNSFEEKTKILQEFGKELEKYRELLGACPAICNTCDTTNTYCTSCNPGYYLSEQTCLACTAPCATCQTDATTCLSCDDNNAMTLTDSACICNDPNALFNVPALACQCKTGYYQGTTSCQACQNPCSACNGNANTCTSCVQGYYLHISLCLKCEPPCFTCSGSQTCLSCDDPSNMSLNTGAGTCTCNDPNASFNMATTKCACNSGYFGTPGSCAACQPPCSTCTTSGGTCESCTVGYWLNGVTCYQCEAPCATCLLSATDCQSCDDNTHMTLAAAKCTCIDPNASFNTPTSLCQCNSGYFGSSNACTACSSQCATCTNAVANCQTCVDTTHMSAAPACNCPENSALTAGSCVCQTGYYFSSNTVCSACTSPCSQCNGAATTCTTCIDGYYLHQNVCLTCQPPCFECNGSATACTTCDDATHMTLSDGACTCTDPNASFNVATVVCVCNPGYWSNTGTCDTCSLPCTTCSTSASTCTSCPNGYYLNGSTCSLCQAPCNTCETSATNCLSCNDPTHTTLAGGACKCIDQNTSFNTQNTACQCNSGYFGVPNNCAACASNCATCSTTAANCLTCIDTIHMSAAPTCGCPNNSAQVNSACVCNNGFYFSSNSVCSTCAPQCSTCSALFAACTQCSDLVHMGPAPTCSCPTNGALVGTTCVCSAGYYFSSNTVCSSCSGNCATCATTAGNCLACIDTTHMSAAPACTCPTNSVLTDGTCVCPNGYFYSTATTCVACSTQCATCSTSSTNCQTCVDTTHMSAAPACNCPANSALTAGSCVCQTGYYFSSNTVCSACASPCSQCNGAATTCTACIDGYYLHQNVCLTCQPPCFECNGSATACTTCDDATHMTLSDGACTCTDPNASFNVATVVCVCNPGYWSNAGTCDTCSLPCQTCSTSASTCTSCPNGYYLNGSTCSLCQAPCNTCETSATNCLSCNDPTHTTLTGGSCACSDPNASFNTQNTACQCNPGYFGASNACAACTTNCATCITTAANCQTCEDSTHMSAAPACACPTNSAQIGSSCVCNNGFYYSSSAVCSACGPQCLTCSGLNTCTQCSDSLHMSSPPACECPTNGVLQETACVCNAGYYFSSNTVCSSCNSNCATCTTTAGNCLACIDTTHMSAAPACTCPTNSVLTDGTCVCPNGYFYSTATTCVACSTQCATCSTSSTNCQTCVDTTHMSAAPACNCPANSALTAGSCVCQTGYYFSSNTVCSACASPCSQCNGAATTCTACIDGYYLHQNVCLTCQPPCFECNGSATACTTCDDATHMTLSDGACTCTDPNASFNVATVVCVCNPGYWSNAGTCDTCSLPCTTCSTSASTCTSCPNGYYLNGSTCSLCQAPCNTCETSATNCLSCNDPTHTTLAGGACKCIDQNTSFNTQNTACQCNSGYFGVPNTCAPCTTNCATCITTAANCQTCEDPTHMSAVPTCACPSNSAFTNSVCVCNQGYFYSSNTQCSQCQTNCESCSGSAAACIQCIDTIHMSNPPTCACPSNSLLQGQSCVCSNGFYYSSNTQCSACASQCSTCSGTNIACLSCVDTTHMSAAPTCSCPLYSTLMGNTCTCNSGYYYSSTTQCSLCDPHCATCSTTATTCSTCSDTTHMTAAPACACPANSNLAGSSCVCNTGYYYTAPTVCSACSPNCLTCSTNQNVCDSCVDTVHMTDPPNCFCPANSILSGTTCVCNTGYYFSTNTVCTACSTNCATCSAGNSCLTCIDTTHMTAAPNCQCPANSSLQGNSCACSAGYYFSDNLTCSPCQGGCQTCSTSATTCTSCKDTTHMGPVPNCNCPGASTIVQGLCVCNTGYYFSSNTACSECEDQCATCAGSANNCLTCVDTTHTTAAPACACPANSALSGNSCACNTGYFYSSLTQCSACASNCGTCSNTSTNCNTCSDTTHMSAAPTCACPSNSILTTGACVCATGYFYSSTTTCSPCQPQCNTCVNSATNCQTCTDLVHMTPAPACACPTYSAISNGSCICNPGYYFSSNGVCSVCAAQCATCSISNTGCSTCIDHVHMSNPPTCSCPNNSVLTAGNCVCNAGYYFSSDTVCTQCASQCSACSGSTTACTSCVDTTHAAAAPSCACPANSALVGSSCVCSAGYYYSSATVCSPCQVNCATCDSNPNTCDTCLDPTHMSAAPNCNCPTFSTLTAGACVCNTGYFYSSTTQCSACATNCQSCTISSTNCGVCIDTVHMPKAPQCLCPTLSTLVGTSCVCNTGYYWSTNAVCSACSPNCVSCSNSAANCDSCVDTVHMTAAPACACPANSALVGNTCQCNPGYYYSSNSVCSPCSIECATCETNPAVCDTCIDATHMSAAPACQCPPESTLIAGSCSCATGYYFNTATTCAACSNQCAACSQSSANCNTCVDTVHASAAPACSCPTSSTFVGNTCVCNNGYFYSSNTVCTQCSPNCSTCVTTQANCQTCSDPTHMTAAPACSCPPNSFLSNGSCVCNNGYYYSSNTVCSPCNALCQTCNTSPTSCTACTDSTHSNGTPTCACPTNSAFTNNACVCNTGYFYSTNTECSPCANNCQSCVTSTLNCLACVDTVHMSAVPQCLCPTQSTLIANTCVCNTGFYYSSNTVCSACSSQCNTCQTSSTNCLTCIDNVHMSAAPQCNCPTNSLLTAGSCVCNPGYYFSSNTACSACSSQCSTCATSSTNCQTCVDTTHMSAAPSCSCPSNSALTGASCVCNTGYYYSSNTVCSACNSQCATCVTSTTNCLTCVDTAHMTAAPQCSCPQYSTLTTGSCVCNQGYYYSSNSVCSTCTTPCAQCVNKSTFCTACFDSTHMTLSNGQCTCTDPNATFNTNSNMCVCNNGFYNNGSGKCLLCSVGCAICTAANKCSQCYDQNNMINLNTGTCTCIDKNSQFNPSLSLCQCQPGYYQTSSSCQSCSLGCQTCTSPTNCQTCFDQVHTTIWSDGSCHCDDADATFNENQQKCVCADGFWDSGGACINCPMVCQTCTSQFSCNTCFDPTHTVISAGVCVCSDPNSQFNTANQVCGCKAGYYLNVNSCSSCGNGCSSCADSLHCTGCYDALNAAVVNGVCKCNDKNASIYPGSSSCSCNPGYYSSQTNVCTACDSGCSSCNNDSSCKICYDQENTSLNTNGTCTCIDPNKVFSNDELMCVCKSGYYLEAQGNTCKTCDATCAICSAANVCVTCQDSTAMTNNNDGTCSCTSKNDKFSLETDQCESKSGSISLSFSWIWLAILGLIMMNWD